MLIASNGLIKLNITRTQRINNEIAQNYKIGQKERGEKLVFVKFIPNNLIHDS